MAKVTGPLLSMSARGQIGKSQVYAGWRGVPYARQLVIPRNPKTTAQTETRNIFAALSDLWRSMGTIAQAPWTAASSGRPITPRNIIIQKNVPAWKGESDRQAFVGSPGALSGPAPSSVTASAGASTGEVDVDITVPAAPSGWTIASVAAVAFVDGTPTELVPSPIPDGDNNTVSAGVAATVTLAGFDASASVVASGWPVYTRPDGRTAYGPSITVTATAAA